MLKETKDGFEIIIGDRHITLSAQEYEALSQDVQLYEARKWLLDHIAAVQCGEPADVLAATEYTASPHRKDTIAIKVWSRDDVGNMLVDNGFTGTQEQIDNAVDAVVATGMLDALGDCSDEEWNLIDTAIKASGVMEHAS